MANAGIKSSQAGTITNPTLFTSNPLIRVHGTGALTVGDRTVEITKVSSYVFIDCDLEECYKGATNCNGKVEVRWGVNQYGDMYAQTVKTEGLTVNMGGTISGTMNFKGLVMLSAGVQLTNSDKTNISVPSGKVNIVHGGKSYSLINFIKGVANGSIT